MFRQLLTLTLATLIVTLASPAFAVSTSTSFQLTVTVPPHAMPLQAPAAGIEQAPAAEAAMSQTVQYEQIVRNEEQVTVQSIVVL